MMWIANQPSKINQKEYPFNTTETDHAANDAPKNCP